MTPHTESERAEFEAWWEQSGLGGCKETALKIFQAGQLAPTRKQVKEYLFQQDCVLMRRSVAAKLGLAPARNPYTVDVLKHTHAPRG